MNPYNKDLQRLFFIGCKSLQNNMLVNFLSSHSGFPCLHVEAHEPLLEIQPQVSTSDLVLVDILDVGSGLLSGYQGIAAAVALLNIEDEDPLWNTFIAMPEVKGAFCRDVTHDGLLNGIKCIFSGECWLPRKLLLAHLEKSRNHQITPGQDANCLTKRELQILQFLDDGNTNTQIADHLCVSTHTVKTHLYHMFKKINVANRIQALNWARERQLI